jgi:hypothetical protein
MATISSKLSSFYLKQLTSSSFFGWTKDTFRASFAFEEVWGWAVFKICEDFDGWTMDFCILATTSTALFLILERETDCLHSLSCWLLRLLS